MSARTQYVLLARVWLCELIPCSIFHKHTREYISSLPSQTDKQMQLWLENRGRLPVVSHEYDFIHFLTRWNPCPDKGADDPSFALAASVLVDSIGRGTNQCLLVFDPTSGKMLKHKRHAAPWLYIRSLAVSGPPHLVPSSLDIRCPRLHRLARTK
jgi:hypothetical protein